MEINNGLHLNETSPSTAIHPKVHDTAGSSSPGHARAPAHRGSWSCWICLASMACVNVLQRSELRLGLKIWARNWDGEKTDIKDNSPTLLWNCYGMYWNVLDCMILYGYGRVRGVHFWVAWTPRIFWFIYPWVCCGQLVLCTSPALQQMDWRQPSSRANKLIQVAEAGLLYGLSLLTFKLAY